MMDDLNDKNPCGPTEDEMECLCGCRGDDYRCGYFLAVYAFSDEQVRPEHTCCSIPGRKNEEIAGENPAMI